MPRIPRADTGQPVQIANQPNMPMSFGTAPGRALEGLGRSISKLGNAFEAQADQAAQEQEYWNNLERLKWQNNVAEEYQYRQSQYNPDVNDPETWAADQNAWFERRAQELDTKVQPTTPRGSYRHQEFIEQNRGRYRLNNREFADKQITVKRIGAIEGAVTSSFSRLDPSDPAKFEADFGAALTLTERMIDQAPGLSAAQKDELRKNAATLAFKSIETKLGPAALPKVKEWFSRWEQEFKAEREAAPQTAPVRLFTEKVPTPSERREIFKNGGVVVNLDTNWAKGDRQTTPMVVIPDNATDQQRAAAEAYARGIAGLYKERFGTSLEPRVVTRSQNGRGRAATIHTEPFAVTDSRAVAFFSSDEGKAAHAKILQETLGKIPGVHFSIPHDPDRGDRGAHGSGTNEVELARGVIERLQTGGGITDARPSVRAELMQMFVRQMPQLEERYAKFQQAQANNAQVGRWVMGQDAFDQYNADNKKLVNDWAETWRIPNLDNQTLNEALMKGDQRAKDYAVRLIKQLNYVPDPIGSALRTMSQMVPSPNNPQGLEMRATAYEVAASAMRPNNRAFDQGAFKELTEEATLYQAFVARGVSSEEAIARIDETKTPEWQKKKDAASAKLQGQSGLLAAITPESVMDKVSPQWFDPNMDEAERGVMTEEYKEAFEYYFVKYADEASAHEHATQTVQKIYGPTRILAPKGSWNDTTYRGRMMRYPPEQSYPAVGGSHEYMHADLKASAAEYLKREWQRQAVTAATMRGEDPSKIKANPIGDDIDLSSTVLSIHPVNPVRAGEKIASRSGYPVYMVVVKNPYEGGQPPRLAFMWGMGAEDVKAAQDKFAAGLREKRTEQMKGVQQIEDTAKRLREMAPKPEPADPATTAARERVEGRMEEALGVNEQALRERDERRRRQGRIPGGN